MKNQDLGHFGEFRIFPQNLEGVLVNCFLKFAFQQETKKNNKKNEN